MKTSGWQMDSDYADYATTGGAGHYRTEAGDPLKQIAAKSIITERAAEQAWAADPEASGFYADATLPALTWSRGVK